MGKVLGIATRKRKRAPMDTHSKANITFEKGVGNDSRGLIKGNRQVTVLTIEDWRIACQEINSDTPWTTRRANLLIENIELKNTKGKVLIIGDVQLEIMGELNPCGRMDEQVAGLTNALLPNWRGGVKCKILKEGKVKEGDTVVLEATFQ